MRASYQDHTEHNVSYSKAEIIYLFFCSWALIMFFFAHAPFIIEKAFYVPCAGAFVTSFFLRYKWDNIDTCLSILIFLSILSDVVNLTHPVSLESPLIRQTIGILCFNKMRKINLSFLIKWIALSAPLIIALIYIFNNPATSGIFRYAGFSGDPNYFAISLNLLITISVIYLYLFRPNKSIKAIIIATIVAILPLFIAGKSRAGIVSALLLLLFILLYYTINSQNKLLSIGITISLYVFLPGYIYKNYGDDIDAISTRFEALQENKGGARKEQLIGIVNVYKQSPYYFFFGVGIDQDPREIPEFRKKSRFIIHNTLAYILFHQGIFSLYIFLCLFYLAFRASYKHRLRLIYSGLLLSLLLNINSVQSTTYLTFWFSFFFIQGNRFTVLKKYK